MSETVPDSFRQKINSLEDELNRDVCGYPDDQGDPCSQWPVENDAHGRCHKHSGRSLSEAFQEDRTDTGSASVRSAEESNQNNVLGSELIIEDDESSRTTPIWMTFQHSILYWGIIVLVGLTTGGASGVYFSGATSTEINNEPTPVNQEQLNLRNPDFGQIRNLFREGQYDQVESRLSTLHQNSPNPTIRAKALYFRYVFQQQQGNYQRSLELAETFLQEFQNHPRRAEIAYGAWFLSTEMLNEPNRAERFKKLLQDEFPDTKWAERLSS